jgi:hypothetical protein
MTTNKIVHPMKVTKIMRLIDRQILNRVEQLATFIQLKKSIDHRMFHGQLHQSDLDYINQTLMSLLTVKGRELEDLLTTTENSDGQDNSQTT